MRIFDNHKKTNWLAERCEIKDSNIILSPSGIAETFITNSPNAKIKVIGKKISGDGEVVVNIFSKDKVVIRKKLIFSTKSSKEFSADLGEIPNTARIHFSKPKNSMGRVCIERVVIDSYDNDPVSLEHDFVEDLSIYRLDSKYTPTIRMAVVVPYSIYGGGEVYLKNIFKNTPESFDVTFLYLNNNLLKENIDAKNIRHVDTPTLNRLENNLVLNNYDCVVYYNSLNVYKKISNLKTLGKISSKIFEIYHSDFVWGDAVSKLRSRDGVMSIFRVSENLADDITGLRDDQKIYMPTGIDTERFAKFASPTLNASSLGIDDKKIIFGTVARLSPEKNIKYAIDIVSRVENSHLVIVGDGPERKELERYSGNSQDITFVGSVKNVEDYYNLFDCFLLTSNIEGMPISILEAMSTGLPIYSTDVGSIKQNIGRLDGVHILTNNLELDAEVIRGTSEKGLFIESLRAFVENNHKDSVISMKFFLGVIDGSMNYVYNFDSDTFDGEYI